MAQTKKTSSKSSSSKSNGASRSSSKSSNKASRSSSKSSKPSASGKRKRASGSKTKKTPKSRSQASKAGSKASSSRSVGAVTGTVKSAAEDAAGLARKAKTPLVASGAAVAGLAGAVALSKNGKGLAASLPKRSKIGKAKKRVSKVHMPKGKEIRTDARKLAGAVTDAAKKADHFSKRMSSVAKAVEKVGETANDAAKKA